MNTSRGGAGAEPSDYVQARLDRLLASPASQTDRLLQETPSLQVVTDGPRESHAGRERPHPLGKRSVVNRSGRELEPSDAKDSDGGAAEGDEGRHSAAEPRRPMPERFRLERRHIPALVVIVLLALGLMLFSIMRAQSQTLPLAVSQAAAPPAASQRQDPSVKAPSAADPSVARIEIHVAGAVKKPGVVLLQPGARVHDALKAAGGVRKGVKTGTLNLAQPLTDGQQVFVGSGKEGSGIRTGAQGAGTTGTGETEAGAGEAGAGSAGSGSGLVNLNTATPSELEQLPGVGPVMAGKIVDWRASHNRFSAVTELQEIDGVGPKTYARLAPLVTV